MTKIAVLGGGLVGGAIARDLAREGEFYVTVHDVSRAVLDRYAGEHGITARRSDLSRPESVQDAVQHADIVVGAVPGYMGYATVAACLEAGKPVVDISFFPEDGAGLDELARARGVPCIVDFGVAPGCTHLFFGHARATMARVRSYTCYVGGLPRVRTLPWEYRATFSPVDVLEEYTRPARILRGGEVLSLPALSERELVEFEGVGTLEAFLTDGLRSMLPRNSGADGVETMVEKTCRYPGYAERIGLLLKAGLLSPASLTLADGRQVVPLEVTSRLLFDAWKLRPGEEDLMVMRVRVEGEDADGRLTSQGWDLLDRHDAATDTTAMARTTGYTCTAGVRLLARGLWTQPGVIAPEVVGEDRACFDFVLADLASRGVVYRPTH